MGPQGRLRTNAGRPSASRSKTRTATKKSPLWPGELRTRHVKVRAHIPDPADLSAFLKRFAEAYNGQHLSKLRKVIGVAASHHRLLWIHPFVDGNGRVARLLSHAWSCSTWAWAPKSGRSSRGLARNVAAYRVRLMACRRATRAAISMAAEIFTQAGLNESCRFFLQVCVDQVSFYGRAFGGFRAIATHGDLDRGGIPQKNSAEAPGRCCVKQ